jgi:hypothetical protein
MELQSLLDELERQQPLKWDQKVSASQLEMILFRNQVKVLMKEDRSLTITNSCHDQIAERLEIPVKYYHKLLYEASDLLAENVNFWLKRIEKEYFLRCLGDSVRAFVSDRYRVIDHLDVLHCALNELQAHETEVEDCFLSETEMNLKVKSGKLKDFIRHKDDLMIGGLFLTNSETGHKALRIEPRLFRVQCSNGMIIEEFKTRQIHLGNGNEDSDELVYLSIRRSIRELFERFGEIIQSLRETTEIKVRNPKTVISNVVKHYGLSEAQKENILIAFGAEPEHDQFGIANALTRAAKSEESWEKSTELERIGGKLITLPVSEFKHLDE